MALTKLPKNAFGTGSVDDSKIEDGTIQNQEISGTIPADKLNSTQDLSSKTVTLPNTSVTNDMLSGSIANAKLSNSTITINDTSISLGGSSSIGVNVNWQSVQTTGFTAVAGNGYFVDTTSGAITVTLPASATLGDQIAIKDYAGTFASNNLLINRNGHNIQGVASNSLITTNRASLLLVYVDSTKGWIYVEESNVADLRAPTFTSATGGTVTESGDFKIHTFTGDGCFVVSTLGNGPTYSGGPSNVDYLVIAGGGGGGVSISGGGGAGGYRTTFPSPGCNAGTFPISTTTYPITVGAGGAGHEYCVVAATNGSPSIFSTITSAGGGKGGPESSPGFAGGSGGGGGHVNCGQTNGGAGNTPPTSPSQGNTGGTNFGPTAQGAGGGGAGSAGTNTGPGPGPGTVGTGGNGLANSITGSPVTRAGGGGGAGYSAGSTSPGPGGPGGGGAGANNGCTPAVSGTANTGGGGGGGSNNNPGVPVITNRSAGGSGGSGIVIIRYKFQ